VPKKDGPPKTQSARKPASKKQQSRSDVVRSAAAQAIEATAGQAGLTRERAQQLADELAHAATRVRETLDELRPAGHDELRVLRERVAALEERVSTLEGAQPKKRTTTPRRTTPAKRTGTTAAKRQPST
jgi:polyhydroxyalkanoate synthesis regulator phasin